MFRVANGFHYRSIRSPTFCERILHPFSFFLYVTSWEFALAHMKQLDDFLNSTFIKFCNPNRVRFCRTLKYSGRYYRFKRY